MADYGEEPLVHIGHAIHALLERITVSKTNLPDSSKARQTLNLIIDDGDRFKIWSTSMGLLIPGHGSFDYRVREAETLSETFRSFLIDLRDNFEEVLTLGLQDTVAVRTENDIAENDSVDDEDDEIMTILLESIKDITDRLFRLATKLRSPETRLRSSRAQKFQILDQGIDLFKAFGAFDYDFVSSLFQQYRRGCKLTNIAEATTPPNTDSKHDVDDQASKYLIERIALANVARRRQFAYWDHHHLKLIKHTEAAVAVQNALQPPKAILGPTNPAPTMTISTATQLLTPTRDFDDSTSTVTVSEYMPFLLGEHGDTVVFPPPPKVAVDSKFFECPYCFTTCARKTLKEKAWQAHLIHDLRPYICTFKNCTIADQLYDNKFDWIQHEATNHATTRGYSVRAGVDDLKVSESYTDDVPFEGVLIKGSAQEAVLVEPTNTAGRSCPVCGTYELPTAQLNDHIAAHLERMAVFSMPKVTSMAGVEDDAPDSGAADGGEDSRSFGRESNISFDSAPVLTLDEDPPIEGPSRSEPPHISEVEEQEHAQDLAMAEKALGRDYSLSLDTIVEFADSYHDQGRLKDAEQMYRQVLLAREKELGLEHPLTLDTICELGRVCYGQGKLQEAEQMFRQALSARKKVLGSNHQSTLNTVCELGRVCYGRAKLQEAEQMFRQALSAQEKVLGPDHPSTLNTVCELGRVCYDQWKLQEAEQMFRQALSTCEKVLEPEHPLSLTTIRELGRVYHRQGRLGEAEQMSIGALFGFEKAFGPDNLGTLSIVHDLGRIYAKQGKYKEAITMYQRSLAWQTSRLGSDHPRTLAMAQDLEDLELRAGEGVYTD